MLAQRLARAWASRGRQVDDLMRFTHEGLVFGAGSVLAKAAGDARDVRVDPGESRLRTLLAAAHLSQPRAAALTHLAKAADRWREGDEGLAAMHLALSGLSRLARPAADAHRLFLADGLLKAGLDEADVLAALGSLTKYDPDQPRVPAGSGQPSGQWTSDGSADGSSAASNTPAVSPATPQVNPGSVTPADDRRYVPGFPFHGEDACAVAIDECRAHARSYRFEDQPPSDEDYIAPGLTTRIAQCHAWALVCEGTEALVKHPETHVSGGIVTFPDGGQVIVKRGQDPVYYPPYWRGRAPPIWRGGRPLPRPPG